MSNAQNWKTINELRKENSHLQTENKEYKKIIERIVEYFCSDKALFPQGTLKGIYTDAEQALKGGK